MARLILDYYQGETEYSDGEIEEELLDIVKTRSDLEAVIEQDSRWPVVCHFSHLRQNLLDWYPFKAGAEILEVGAGCGAMTSLFCEKAARVTAVELTHRRAQINYLRNQKYENLDLYAGDIFKLGFDRQFDYIVVVGVLEYAAFMSLEQDPYADFLHCIKRFLKPEGHILLAIENRCGLKYFAGAREDHTASFFEGIDGYNANSRIRTFTKGELTRLLNKAGLAAHKFYYPLPDYKFASGIYTDETINGFAEWMDLSVYDNQRYALFDELGVMHMLAAEGALDRFANSFLVDIAADGRMLDSGILSVKVSAARNHTYRIATIIRRRDGERIVEKVPLTQACVPHLHRMAENYAHRPFLHGVALVACRVGDGGAVVFDYAVGQKYAAVVAGALQIEGEHALWPLLDRYRERLFDGADTRADLYAPPFSDFFGAEQIEGALTCACPANVDLTLDNLMVNADGSLTAIDYEWIVDFPVPCDYIFWRAIRFTDVFKFSAALADEIYDHYGITIAMRDTFFRWEYAFSTKKIGSALPAAQPTVKLDLNRIDPGEQHCDSTMGLAFDYGGGFDYERAIHRRFTEIGGLCTVRALVADDAKAVRFDPVEGFACQCRIVSTLCGGRPLMAKPQNQVASDEAYDFFLTLDPVYFISGVLRKGELLEIHFIAQRLDTSALDILLTNRRAEQQVRMEDLERRADGLKVSYDQILSSHSWRLTEPLRKCKRLIGGG